jgi:hypothetical protein
MHGSSTTKVPTAPCIAYCEVLHNALLNAQLQMFTATYSPLFQIQAVIMITRPSDLFRICQEQRQHDIRPRCLASSLHLESLCISMQDVHWLMQLDAYHCRKEPACWLMHPVAMYAQGKGLLMHPLVGRPQRVG